MASALMSSQAHPPSFRPLLLVLSFLESFATILLERAIYFFSTNRLGYSEHENLLLALCFGVTYTLGAASSHALSRRLRELRALAWSLVGLLALHAWLAFFPGGASLVVGFALVGLLEGCKWPIIESYVAAGLGPQEQLRAVGRFNVSWALAAPLALALAGPLIASGHPAALFALAAGINLFSLALLLGLPARAPHIEASHPSRPLHGVVERYRALLASSRWSMLSSYALMFLLVPLMPEVYRRLGSSVERATFWASWLDAVRVLTFALLAILPGWHGRVTPLIICAIGLPLGFTAIIASTSLALVLFGEIVFGVLAGTTYYAALYYALVVKNASVDAGGTHEGLIGLGLVLGPVVGLIGHAVASSGGTYHVGLLLGALPLIAACWFGSLRSLGRARAA
jgi:MFS family permease